jgi:hypothetical protein
VPSLCPSWCGVRLQTNAHRSALLAGSESSPGPEGLGLSERPEQRHRKCRLKAVSRSRCGCLFPVPDGKFVCALAFVPISGFSLPSTTEFKFEVPGRGRLTQCASACGCKALACKRLFGASACVRKRLRQKGACAQAVCCRTRLRTASRWECNENLKHTTNSFRNDARASEPTRRPAPPVARLKAPSSCLARPPSSQLCRATTGQRASIEDCIGNSAKRFFASSDSIGRGHTSVRTFVITFGRHSSVRGSSQPEAGRRPTRSTSFLRVRCVKSSTLPRTCFPQGDSEESPLSKPGRGEGWQKATLTSACGERLEHKHIGCSRLEAEGLQCNLKACE